MNYSFYYLLILSISFSYSLTPLHSIPFKQNQFQSIQQKSKTKNIPYCGTYKANCTSYVSVSEETTVIFKGQKGKTPVEMSIIGTMYDESNCIASKWRYQVRNIYSIAHTSNGFYSTKWKNIYITLSSDSIEKLGCNPPLKPNKEYDIAKTACMNDNGEDQFQLFRNNIGEESDLSIVFTETTASYSITTETRVSSSGCSISTIQIIIIIIIVIIIIACIIIAIIFINKRNKRQLPRK